MEELDVYQGRARRRCECGLEIEIEKPTRVLSRTSNRAWRKKARQEIARQLLWEAMCDDCRAFWNRVLRAVETVPGEEDENGEMAQAAGAAAAAAGS